MNIEPGKYITVFADASHCPYTRAWGYGFWAKWGIPAKSAYRSGGGQNCPNATVAESQALEAALRWILQEVAPREAKGKILVVQSDCTGALSKLLPLLKSVKKTLKLEKAYTKHVKGHQGYGDARSAVNEICDKKAKKEMKIQRAAWYADKPSDNMEPAREPSTEYPGLLTDDDRAAFKLGHQRESEVMKILAATEQLEEFYLHDGMKVLENKNQTPAHEAQSEGLISLGWKEDEMPEKILTPEEQIAEWIDTAERKYRQFNEPEKYGKPPDNPGNGMWARDAKAWASYTPEQKREAARMNLYPPAGTRKLIRY